MTDSDARPSGEEQQNRTTVYVASIPGMTQWSDDYDALAEWAGGEENIRLWDLTDRCACDGCGRNVTLMGNGYCGHCQDEAPELLTDGGRGSKVGLQEVTAVTWIDDDGTRYRRTIEDGEIVDREVGHAE
jgi:WD40 repeat protein